MDHLPQIVGLKCSACNRLINSITEGDFCDLCYNPVHNACRPADGSVVAEDRCPTCGADPKMHSALAVKAEVDKEMASGKSSLLCPNCGSTRGFKPYGHHDDSKPAGGLMIFSLFWFMFFAFFQIITGLSRVLDKGEYECLKCGHVFRAGSG